jgi:PAS domain S-box-containing protein
MTDRATLHPAALRALFEMAPDAMIVTDANGRIVLANPQAENLFGYTLTQLRTLSVEALVPENVRAAHRHHRARYVAEPRLRPMGTGQELAGRRADGAQFPVEIALNPIHTEDGIFYVASIRDISETQRARRALTRSRYDAIVADIGRRMLESASQDVLFETIPGRVALELGINVVAIVIAQPGSPAIRVRAAVGLGPELQQLLPELLPPEYFDTSGRSAQATLVRADDRSHPEAALRSRLADAGYHDFAAAPMFDRSRPMGALVAAARAADSLDDDKVHFLQSVAHLLAAMMQRNRTEEQLAHAQRLDAVGQLTGGVAHDFNNMLTVISGNLQLLEIELADRPASLEILGSAMHAVGRGAGLTRKLLAFARRQRLNPQAIDPRKLLGELQPILARTLGEKVVVRFDCAEELPSVFVDPGELDTAILNLALNARDAMPRGGALQLVAREQLIGNAESSIDLAPGDYVVISVQDTGLGMAPEVLARAFEPFFTTKESGRGSGLGLSMVYGFVKQSGGHLTADSRLGYGTRIDLYLPAVRSGATASRGETTPASRGGGETVLVVEDEKEVRTIAVAFLNSLGYATHEAADADQALHRLAEHPDISVLFSDVILGSGLDGHELAQAALRLRPDLRVLLTSGYENPPALSEPGTVKAPLLRKPYRREELATAIRGAIDRRS